MRYCARLAAAAALLFATSALPTAAEELSIGDDAPAFELVGSDGKTYKLSDYKDKQSVMIAWYPKAFTGG